MGDPERDELLERFCAGFPSEATRRSYASAIRRCLRQSGHGSARELVDAYLALPHTQVARRLLSLERSFDARPNSIRLWMQALCGLLTAEGILPCSPPYLMETQPPASPVTEAPTYEEIGDVLAALQMAGCPRHLRTASAIALAAYCGLGTGDLCELVRKDVDTEHWLVEVWESRVKRGKRKRQLLPIPDAAREAIQAQLDATGGPANASFLRKLSNNADQDLAVDPGPMQPRALQRDAARAGRLAGIERLTFQSLRRRFHLGPYGQPASWARQVNPHYRKEASPGHTGVRRSRPMGAQRARDRKRKRQEQDEG